MELGANGVEIDVRSNAGDFWNLDHDHIYTKQECDREETELKKVHVSLEWFLTQPVAKYDENTKSFSVKLNDDPRLCALWIDCKDEEYMEELVNYVHSFIPEGQEKFNFSIIYNLYTVRYTTEYLQKIHRVNKILKDNEYLNWGNCEMEEIQDLYSSLNERNLSFSPLHHFFTRGVFNVDQPQNTSASKRQDLKSVQYMVGTFCKRYGVWSNVTVNNAEAWINFGMQAVLTYFDEGVRPTVECRPDGPWPSP